MSLRANIYPFSMAALESRLGSGDVSLAAAMRIKLANRKTFRDAALEARSAEILGRAIMDGAPFDDLEVEGEVHVAAAHLLALPDETPAEVGASAYGVSELTALADSFPALAQTSYRYFTTGRPLFGKRIESPWSYYAYLLTGEVELLRAAVTSIVEVIPRAPAPIPPEDPALHEASLRQAAELVSTEQFSNWIDQLEARALASERAVDIEAALRAGETLRQRQLATAGTNERLREIQRRTNRRNRDRDAHMNQRMLVNAMSKWLTKIGGADLWFLAY